MELVLNDFNISDFESAALEIFRFQYYENEIYKAFVHALKINPDEISRITEIPFLPIQFFKSHIIKTSDFVPEAIFESSGTTQSINSRHFIKNNSIYKNSFLKAFELFYGNPAEWCIIGLLPSYLERNNSSLVVMVNELIRQSNHPDSGFYLFEQDKLNSTLQNLEQKQQKTLLIGVTFALLDFAEKHPLPLQHTVIMETGGMKGRRQELTRDEVQQVLKKAFLTDKIHSEYGMTELLSQAYSKGDGLFSCPPWMKVLMRDEDDPMNVNFPEQSVLTGTVNIIDLANIYSCSFIATEDAGRLYPNGSFEILGRIDYSDIRGCSLLAL
ncbi:MAG: acyl transferase [Bacteroidetes bacterium]|nr:acyl transferase [Bacteroidota bacterium]